MTRTAGLWAANGPNPNLNRMIDLVKDGAYTVLHEAVGAEQARAIHARYADAPILVRHHCYNWDTTDPIQWAREVVTRMKDYAGITKRLVGANEMNLEPNANFSEANYRAIGTWYGKFASEVRRLDASLVIHFPAFAAGHSEDQNDLGFIAYLLPSVLAAIRSSNAVNCHTYWSPDEGPLREMGNYGGGLRYRKVQRLLKENGIEWPIWIDEAGPWAQPWRVEQTAAHSEAVHRDGLLACTYFLWADPTNNAGNTINQWHGKVPDDKLDWLAQEWDRIAMLPVTPEPEPPMPSRIVDVVDKLPKHATLKYATRTLDKIKRVVIHHSAVRGTISAEAIARYHVAEPPNGNGWPGIGYSYYIPSDGTIYQTNALTTISYHALDANATSVGICFGGDFTKEKPTDIQLESGKWLLGELYKPLGLSAKDVLGHRDANPGRTACPGGDWWKAMLVADEPLDIEALLDEARGVLNELEAIIVSTRKLTGSLEVSVQHLLDTVIERLNKAEK